MTVVGEGMPPVESEVNVPVEPVTHPVVDALVLRQSPYEVLTASPDPDRVVGVPAGPDPGEAAVVVVTTNCDDAAMVVPE
jgi:hypothetical protein